MTAPADQLSESPFMTSQPATFYADGLRLAGTFTPAAAGGTRPAIICVHGYTGRKETYMPPFVRDLTAAGYHTLDFYHRGFGDSEARRAGSIPRHRCATFWPRASGSRRVRMWHGSR